MTVENSYIEVAVAVPVYHTFTYSVPHYLLPFVAAGKRVLVRCYTHEDFGLLVAIRDEGKGFDPEDIPDPRNAERIHLHHGRGVFMMRELMDQVMHRKGGREVVLYKKRSKGNSDDSGPSRP